MEIPALHGNWVDLVILLFLAFYTLDKARAGFIHAFIDFAGFIISFLIALRFYAVAGNIIIANFNLSHGFANAIGFFAVAIIIELLIYFLAIFIEHYIPPSIINSPYNKKTGFIPAAFSGILITAFLITTAIALPIRPNIKQDIINSRIGGFLSQKALGLEQSVSHVFGGVVEDALTFLTVKPHGEESVSLNFKTSQTSVDPESEKKMFQLVNKERADRGIATLIFDDALAEVGRKHCKDMFTRGYFSHYTPENISPFDRMNADKIIYKTAGENLAYAPTVDIAHTGLMNSPGHKANILSVDFGKVGIGVIDAGVYGKMFCQEFSD